MKLLSPAIKAASAFAMGGIGFAVANLLLARSLSTQAYGEFSLVLAVAVFAIALGPLSLDGVILRHRPGPLPRLFGASLATGLVVAALAAIATAVIYSVATGFLAALFVVVAAGSVARLAASIYQSEKRYATSLWLIQSQNVTLVGAAIVSLFLTGMTAQHVMTAYAVHWLLIALASVFWLRYRYRGAMREDWHIPWKETLPLFGSLFTVQLAAQLDRLIIPKLLDIENLALFGVLSALVLAPYKMFQMGIGYTLVPGLRNAESQPARKRVLVHEAWVTVLIMLVGALSGFLLAPWVAEVFLKGKYVLDVVLIASAVFAGIVRIVAMFSASIVTALGSQVRLEQLNRGSWLALAFSLAGGWWGSQWGLAGLVFGFALGGVVRILIAGRLAQLVWQQPTGSHADV